MRKSLNGNQGERHAKSSQEKAFIDHQSSNDETQHPLVWRVCDSHLTYPFLPITAHTPKESIISYIPRITLTFLVITIETYHNLSSIMPKGPTSFAFKAMRLILLAFLIATTALFVLGVIFGVMQKFRQVDEWRYDSWGSSTWWQRDQIERLRVAASVAASIVALSVLQLVVGFLGFFTLRMPALVLFAMISIIIVILAIVQLIYEDSRNVSIGWLIVTTFEVIISIAMIRELRAYDAEQVRRRVTAAEVKAEEQ